MKRIVFIIAFFYPLFIFAQGYKTAGLSDAEVRSIQEEYQLEITDVSEMKLKQKSISKQNGLTHLYFNQTANNIEIHKAILNVHVLPNGEILHTAQRFISDATSKTNASQFQIKAIDAIAVSFGYLGLVANEPTLLEQDQHSYLFQKNNHVLSDLPVWLCYWKNEDGQLILAWNIGLEMKNTNHAWLLTLDALTGELLEQVDLMDHCSFDVHHSRNGQSLHSLPSSTMMNPDSYQVFPYNIESPSHGTITTAVNPAHPESSPFGWHDQDGAFGAETTITFGNNCHAFQDRDGDLATSGDEPSGGASLDFNSPIDLNAEPATYVDFSVIQAFYLTNVMHDVSYLYGFDEEHGNFQFHNYNGSDGTEDYVNVLCQHRGGLEPDPDDTTTDRNNANFFSGFQDGDKGRLRTYLWTEQVVDAERLIITTPSNIAGGYIAGLAQFGTPLTNVPITGELILADPIGACEDIVNDLQGKIAVIERGNCNFSAKVYRAEQQGAIAVIICNTEDGVIDMLGGDFGALVTIPSIMISKSDCELILPEIPNGAMASLQLTEIPGPSELDASIDNGVVAHEYAHGISRRLTGGKSTTACLNNEEEMGEGWSDFFTLVLTTTSGMTGEMPRGIGTYLLREPTDGQGLRAFPYSTDMNVNPSTYDDIITASIPHGVGMVWNSMLWDLYWAMVEEYGFDDDVYTGEGGNNMCIQLVIDGMKMQACEPGFVDARDAILAADIANYGGANQCLIWEVFARRGLGYSANQGSSDDVNDGEEAFDVLPICLQELKITKTATPEIEAGDVIDITIVVSNDLEVAQSQVLVTDVIPNGTQFLQSSANKAFSLNGNQVVFDLGNLAVGESQTINYQLKTDDQLSSTFIFRDGFENDLDLWGNPDFWQRKSTIQYEGQYAAFIDDIEMSRDIALELQTPINLNVSSPALRWTHYYETDPAADGGVVEFSIDGGATWNDAGQYLFRNGYRGTFQDNPILENQAGFWGNNGDFERSYMDLTDFQGENIQIRYRFVTNNENGGNGWYLDDVGFLDLYHVNGEVCVATGQGETTCTTVPEKGSIILPKTSIPDITAHINVTVFPNPSSSSGVVNVFVQSIHAEGNVSLSLYDLDGRLIMERSVEKLSPIQNFTLPLTGSLKQGYYILRVVDGDYTHTEKILVRNE